MRLSNDRVRGVDDDDNRALGRMATEKIMIESRVRIGKKRDTPPDKTGRSMASRAGLNLRFVKRHTQVRVD